MFLFIIVALFHVADFSHQQRLALHRMSHRRQHRYAQQQQMDVEASSSGDTFDKAITAAEVSRESIIENIKKGKQLPRRKRTAAELRHALQEQSALRSTPLGRRITAMARLEQPPRRRLADMSASSGVEDAPIVGRKQSAIADRASPSLVPLMTVSSAASETAIRRHVDNATSWELFPSHQSILELFEKAIRIPRQQLSSSAEPRTRGPVAPDSNRLNVHVLVLIAVRNWAPVDVPTRVRRWTRACREESNVNADDKNRSCPSDRISTAAHRCSFVLIFPCEYSEADVREIASLDFGHDVLLDTVRVNRTLASSIYHFHQDAADRLLSSGVAPTHLFLTTLDVGPRSRYFISHLLRKHSRTSQQRVVASCSLVMHSSSSSPPTETPDKIHRSVFDSSLVPHRHQRLLVDGGSSIVMSRAAFFTGSGRRDEAAFHIVRRNVGHPLPWQDPNVPCSNVEDDDDEYTQLVSPYCALIPTALYVEGRKLLQSSTTNTSRFTSHGDDSEAALPLHTTRPAFSSSAKSAALILTTALLRSRISLAEIFQRSMPVRMLLQSSDGKLKDAVRRITAAVRSSSSAYMDLSGGHDFASLMSPTKASLDELPDMMKTQEELLRSVLMAESAPDLEDNAEERVRMSFAIEALLNYTKWLAGHVLNQPDGALCSSTKDERRSAEEQDPWWLMLLLLRRKHSDAFRIVVSQNAEAYVLPMSGARRQEDDDRSSASSDGHMPLLEEGDVAFPSHLLEAFRGGLVFPPSFQIDMSRPLGQIRDEFVKMTLHAESRALREHQLSRETADALDNIRVVWYVICCHCCGFSNEVEQFFVALDRLAHVYLPTEAQCFCNGSLPSTRDVLSRRRVHPSDMKVTPKALTIWISHTAARDYSEIRNSAGRLAQYFIGRSMCEYSRIRPLLVNASNTIPDEIWVPSKFVFDSFLKSGVTTRMEIIPEPIDVDTFDPRRVVGIELPPAGRYRYKCNRQPANGSNIFGQKRSSSSFNFFSDFKWEPRKGWAALFEAYFTAFRSSSSSESVHLNVTLYVLTHVFFYEKKEGDDEHDTGIIFRDIDKVRVRLGMHDDEVPTFCIIADRVPGSEMPSLYKAMDAFVLPTLGEGWGLPAAQALSMALPVISTNWGGSTEFLKDNHCFLIPIDSLQDVPVSDKEYTPGAQWANPSVKATVDLLRLVVANRDEAAERGRRGRQFVSRHFAPHVVAKIVAKRLGDIWASHNSSSAVPMSLSKKQ